jgi:hypothetical protein
MISGLVGRQHILKCKTLLRLLNTGYEGLEGNFCYYPEESKADADISVLSSLAFLF